MIIREKMLDNVDAKVKQAIEMFHFGLGKRYDIQVISGKCDESKWNMLVSQGGELNHVNKLRIKNGLHEFRSDSNVKIANNEWQSSMTSGNGIMFTIQNAGYRYRINSDIESVIEWIKSLIDDVKIENVSNNKFDVFMLSIEKVKTKKQKEKQIDESIIETNENKSENETQI